MQSQGVPRAKIFTKRRLLRHGYTGRFVLNPTVFSCGSDKRIRKLIIVCMVE